MKKAFKNNVVTGLQLFMTLQLPGRPPQDIIAATAEVWIELLHPVRRWDDEDITNLQRAFKSATRRADKFPAPANVIAALEPKIIVTTALPKPPLTSECKAKIDSIIQDLFNTLNTQQ